MSQLHQDLKTKHPAIHYRNYSYSWDKSSQNLTIKFDFLLEPDLAFTPESTIRFSQPVKSKPIDNLVFHLGLIELLSYWKAAAPDQVVIHSGSLSTEQIKWWQKLFRLGMGEYFATNNLKIFTPDIICKAEFISSSSSVISEPNGNLILVGGGKDSCVTLDSFKHQKSNNVLLVNPTPAALKTSQIAGFTRPIRVERQIDPHLINLNQQGYLNGHTPFSAYLSFLSLIVAELLNFKYILASNEQSANEPTTNYHGQPVNHQYSKSFEYESDFRNYTSQFLTTTSEYLSFLRPLYELQIAKVFSRLHSYHSSFVSCNVGGSKGIWCCQCPKCLFNYLILSPFLEESVLAKIFKDNLLHNQQLAPLMNSLISPKLSKPFECVGTQKESLIAAYLLMEKIQQTQEPLPYLIQLIKSDILSQPRIQSQTQDLLTQFTSKHHLPSPYQKMLKQLI